MYCPGQTPFPTRSHDATAPCHVSRAAVGAGVESDRSQTAAAVPLARTVDLAAGRLRLAEKMLAASEAMLDDIDGVYLVYNFGGKDNDYNEQPGGCQGR